MRTENALEFRRVQDLKPPQRFKDVFARSQMATRNVQNVSQAEYSWSTTTFLVGKPVGDLSARALGDAEEMARTIWACSRVLLRAHAGGPRRRRRTPETNALQRLS